MPYANLFGSVECSQPWPLGTVTVGNDCRQTVWKKLSPSLALSPEDEHAGMQRHTLPDREEAGGVCSNPPGRQTFLTMTAPQLISPNHGAHKREATAAQQGSGEPSQ